MKPGGIHVAHKIQDAVLPLHDFKAMMDVV